MAELATIATIASIASAGLTAAGTIAAGQAQARRAQAEAKANADIQQWQAKQMIAQGKEEQALAQRKGQQLQRQKKLALSKLTARSAASGFSATDPTTLNLASDIEKYGSYQEGFAKYGGEAARRDLELGAAGRRYSAIMTTNMANQYASDLRASSYLSAGGTILGGLSTMAGKYAPTRNRNILDVNGNPVYG